MFIAHQRVKRCYVTPSNFNDVTCFMMLIFLEHQHFKCILNSFVCYEILKLFCRLDISLPIDWIKMWMRREKHEIWSPLLKRLYTATHRVNSLHEISLCQNPRNITWTVMSTNQQLITSVYISLKKFRTTTLLIKLKVLLLLWLDSKSRTE